MAKLENEAKREDNIILIISGVILFLIFTIFYKYNFASPWTDFTGIAPYYLASWVAVSLIISFFAYLLQIKFELFTRVLIVSYLIVLIFVPSLYFDIHLYSCFDISKVTGIYLLTIVILSVWIIRSTYLGKIEFSIPPLIILLPTSAWLIITFISTILSINPWMAFVGTYKRYEGLLVVIAYLISFYAILTFIPKEKLYWLLLSVVLVAAITSVYGVIQFLGLDPLKWESFSRYRIIGTFGNPVFIAAYLSMAIFVCLSMYIFTAEKKGVLIKGKKKKEESSFKKPLLLLFYGGCIVFIYICFCFTNTRATFVGLSVCTLVFVLYFYGLRFFLLYFPVFTSFFGFIFYIVYQYLSPYSKIALFLGGLSLGFLFFAHLIIGGFIMKDMGRAHKIGLPIIGIALIVLTIIFNLDRNISVAARFFTMVTKKPKAISVEKESVEKVPLKNEEHRKLNFVQKMRDKLTGSAGWRLWMWTTGARIIPDYPWFGIGPDTLGIIFPKYLAKVYTMKIGGTLEMEDRLHNEIFDTGVNRGIIGLIIYFWLIIAFTIYCWKGYRKAEEGRGILILGIYTAWLAYLVQNQFSFGNTPIASLYWMLMAMAVKEIGGVKSFQFNINKNSPIAWAIYPFVFIFAIGFSIFVIRPYLADLHYKDGTVYLARGDWNNAFSKYKKAISLNYREIRYWEELNRAYINYVITTGNREALEEAKNGANTLNKLLKGMSNTAYFTLGMAHFMEGKQDEALKYYKKAKEWQPFIADIYNNIGILYLNMGRPDLAISEFEQALEIRSEYSRTTEHLIRLYLENNEIDRAIGFLTRLSRVLYGDEKRKIHNYLAWIYYNKKQDYKKSIMMSQNILEIFPQDTDSLRNIGLCYYRIGDWIKAKEAFLKLLEVLPDDPQAKSLLLSLSGR
ncbi:MAG: tetratricopeptide repeat protein [bacterium]